MGPNTVYYIYNPCIYQLSIFLLEAHYNFLVFIYRLPFLHSRQLHSGFLLLSQTRSFQPQCQAQLQLPVADHLNLAETYGGKSEGVVVRGVEPDRLLDNFAERDEYMDEPGSSRRSCLRRSRVG